MVPSRKISCAQGDGEQGVRDIVQSALSSMHCIGSTRSELSAALHQLGKLADEFVGDDLQIREAARAIATERLRGFDDFERELDVALRLRKPSSLASDDLPDNVEPLSDLANAYRLVREHGADLRFDKSRGWMVWTGLMMLALFTGCYALAWLAALIGAWITDQPVDVFFRHPARVAGDRGC